MMWIGRSGQLTMVLIVPGWVMVMTPPQTHVAVDPAASAGLPPMNVFGAAGTHGPAIAGMQGIGVSTPSAAAVAAATLGLARLMHMPNGGTFMIGTMSVMVAAGLPSTTTLVDGGTTDSVAGATPKLHCSVAVAVTCGPPIEARPSGRWLVLR